MQPGRAIAFVAFVAFVASVPWLCGCADHASDRADAGIDSGTDTDTDSDTDTDTDSDTDTDTDSDTDSDSDTGTDTGTDTGSDPGDTDPDPACEIDFGGSCAGLVSGCAACGEGALVANADLGCGDGEWCCVPWSPPTNGCQDAGGVCASNMPLVCPTGWVESPDDCGGALSLSCCLPSDACA